MSKANIDQKRLRDVVNASRASYAVVADRRRRILDRQLELNRLRSQLEINERNGGEDQRLRRLVATEAEALKALQSDLAPLEREHDHLNRLASAAREYALEHGALPPDLEF